MGTILPPLLRMLFPGHRRHFTFTRQHVPMPEPPERLNLYVHIPFCRRICAFCPYVKQVYASGVALSYMEAMRTELQRYRDAWGDRPVESVYFGGGTPSLAPEIVNRVLESMSGGLRSSTEIGVEVHPIDVRPRLLRSLIESGVTMVSLGVQSFDDRHLAMLGRGYDARQAYEASELIMSAGFAAVDIDLIFAIPGQTEQEAVTDVSTAFALGAHQVSAYPLIRFAHTSLGSQLSNAHASSPSWNKERRMLKAIVTQGRDAGYERSSIWSFTRPGAPRYTTVTRDSFIGIGAGASSRMGDYFWVNTFHVDEYIRSTESGTPARLATRLDEGDRMAYWLFWRCYDTIIDHARFRSAFGRNMPRRISAALMLLDHAGLARRASHSAFRLTDPGAYLFHLIEKHYTHAYLERLWTACLHDPWPEAVTL